MKEQQETTKLEFLMTVNDNIIVQRFFNIRDFNNNAKNSITLYECIKDFKEQLCSELKMKTLVYLMDNQYEIINNPTVLNTSYTDGPEYFNIYLKQNDKTICHRRFDAKIYPPKIRYTVDVRPHIKSLLYTLTDIFSSENLSYEFAEVNTLG
jgi:hypothetical protein